jgi:NAD(P)-dependent dehydrogenase (short-subunit alcohol dehydrogenase family)
MAVSLAGKTAVITGAGQGIGLAIAKAFAADGALCMLVGRDEKKLALAVDQLPDRTMSVSPATGLAEKQENVPLRGRHEFYRMDVKDPGSWTGLCSKFVSRSTTRANAHLSHDSPIHPPVARVTGPLFLIC